MKTAR